MAQVESMRRTVLIIGIAYAFASMSVRLRAQAGAPLATPITPPATSVPATAPTTALLQKAKEALRANHLGEAIAALEQVVAGDPKNAEAYLILGDAYFAAQKYDAAIGAFQHRITLAPKDSRSYLRLGQVLDVAKQYPAAAKALQTAVELDPRDVDKLLSYGGALVDGGRYQEAETAFERALDLRPADLRVRMNVVSLYLRSKDYSSARKALIDAMGFAPDSAEVHEALGNLDEQENRHQEALNEYDAALRIDGKSGGALMGRASALAGLKRYDEAESIMRRLVAQLPANQAAQPGLSADAHSGLAQVLDTAGKHSEAIAEYGAAIKLVPDSAINWGNLGWAQYNAGDYAGAEKSGRKALELDPKLAYVRLNLGLLFAVQDRWTESEREYREGIAISVVADIRSGINDIRDARAAHPTTQALRRALDMLTAAERKAVGLPE